MVEHLVAAGRGAHDVTAGAALDGPPASSFAHRDRAVLAEPEAKQLLRTWGVAVPPGDVATSADDATRIRAR